MGHPGLPRVASTEELHTVDFSAGLLTGELMIVLLIILILLIIVTTPAWPYSRGWGYYPSSGLGLILLIVIILLLLHVV